MPTYEGNSFESHENFPGFVIKRSQLRGILPRESNIDTQHSHVSNEIHFPGPIIFGIYVKFLGCIDEVETNFAIGFCEWSSLFWELVLSWFCQALNIWNLVSHYTILKDGNHLN